MNKHIAVLALAGALGSSCTAIDRALYSGPEARKPELAYASPEPQRTRDLEKTRTCDSGWPSGTLTVLAWLGTGGILAGGAWMVDRSVNDGPVGLPTAVTLGSAAVGFISAVALQKRCSFDQARVQAVLEFRQPGVAVPEPRRERAP